MLKLTCEVERRTVLGCLRCGLDKLFQAFVIDIRGCPFWDLISREIVSELHGVCASLSELLDSQCDAPRLAGGAGDVSK